MSEAKIIIIDQGHSDNGQPDPGASGNNLVEAILTGQIGEVVKRQLEGYDCEVLFAPRGELSERADFANQLKADLFVSIHINAGGGTGYESHVHPGASETTLAIAESIHTTMASFYNERGFRDRGLKRSNFAVLRETKMPAVLLENLFIDSVVDAEFLKMNLHAIGNEIAYAIVVAMGLQAKEKEKETQTDPCENCQKVNKLFAENQKMKNVLGNISISTAEYVTK